MKTHLARVLDILEDEIGSSAMDSAHIVIHSNEGTPTTIMVTLNRTMDIYQTHPNFDNDDDTLRGYKKLIRVSRTDI